MGGAPHAAGGGGGLSPVLEAQSGDAPPAVSRPAAPGGPHRKELTMPEAFTMSMEQMFELTLLPREEQSRRLVEWEAAGKVRRIRRPPEQLWLPLGPRETPEDPTPRPPARPGCPVQILNRCQHADKADGWPGGLLNRQTGRRMIAPHRCNL